MGQALGEFPGLRVEARLGEGGMGVVYRAFHEAHRSWVAVKTVHQLSPESVVRFKREFRAMQDIHHPNLVSLGELVSVDGALYFTMELVEGDDFLSYVRARGSRVQLIHAPDASVGELATEKYVRVPSQFPRPRFDEVRLREALAQLADGLMTVHEAGLVHRDVKPSNVIVNREGRLVILDFGLVSETPLSGGSTTDPRVAGTPEYMAPEQALSGRVGPEADWYSVGVMLYETLTGELPFRGTTLEILMQKQQHDVAAPSAVAAGVPPDLDALCASLLRFDPGTRATGRSVVNALGGSSSITAVRSRRSGAEKTIFIGRDRETSFVRAAFEETLRGAAVSVVLVGDSGVGKSSLARNALRVLGRERSDAVILAGRCYPFEAVPYKAFDGVVDALARYLARLPDAEASGVLPTRCAPLLHVFPVLAHVKAFAASIRRGDGAPDPMEVRARAFSALRELFLRLVDRRPVVVFIDDVQWADGDSLALLADLLRPPDAPPILFLCTQRTLSDSTIRGHRGAVEDANDVLAALPGDVRVLDLAALDQVEACELAKQLLERDAPECAASASALALEAAGHPLFIDALVRHASIEGTAVADVNLDDALRAQIDRLTKGPRTLLELLTVAGAPLSRDVLFAASDGDYPAFTRAVGVLRVAHLIATHGARTDDIELVHDRVRATVATSFDDVVRRECHRRLALALERLGARDLESLAQHWSGAGELEKAAGLFLRAGDDASRALAFDRAARLYQTSLRLDAPQGAARRELHEKLGDALSNAGLSARAAAAYREAAVGALGAGALDLQRRASEQLLRSGHFDAGLEATRAVLASVDIPYPKSTLATLFALVVVRLFARLRGYGFTPREESEIPATELTRIDVCRSAAFNLALVDAIRGAAFQVRHLLLALRAGEPSRVARALAYEVGFVGHGGSRTWRRTERVIARATEVAALSRQPFEAALCTANVGIAQYLAGRFAEAIASSRSAQQQFREKCTGAAWEIDTMQLFELNSLAQRGEFRELAELTPAYVRDSVARGDLYGEVNLRIGFPNLRWLVVDNVEGARRELRDAMSTWSNQGFHLEHFYELLAWTNADLYDRGHAEEALARILDRWPHMRRALFLRIQSPRIHMWSLRARAALAAAGTGPRREVLLRAADGDARRLARERAPWGVALGLLAEAGVARMRGDRERALARARTAEAAFVEAGMGFHAAVACRAIGSLVGGTQGRVMISAADAQLTGQGVVRPLAMAMMAAPGLIEPEP